MTLGVILRDYNPGASLTPHCDTFEYDILRAPTGFIFRAKPFSAFFAVKWDLHDEIPPVYVDSILEEEKGNVTSHMYTIAVDPVGKCSNHSVSAGVNTATTLLLSWSLDVLSNTCLYIISSRIKKQYYMWINPLPFLLKGSCISRNTQLISIINYV